MSTLEIKCSSCDRIATLPENCIGKRARCNRCGHAFTVTLPEPIAHPVAPFAADKDTANILGSD